MDKLIGRKQECEELTWAINSQRSELIILSDGKLRDENQTHAEVVVLLIGKVEVPKRGTAVFGDVKIATTTDRTDRNRHITLRIGL